MNENKRPMTDKHPSGSTDYTRLLQQILDLVYEQQLKLGYRSETVRLYFPASSLAHLLNTVPEIDPVCKALSDFVPFAKPCLGEIEVSHQGKQLCLTLPPQASDYVHAHAREDDFLAAFLQALTTPGTTIESLKAVFLHYADNVILEHTNNGEFDYVLYFADGMPNDYRYCIAFEDDGHVTYHRFTPEDYADFGF